MTSNIKHRRKKKKFSMPFTMPSKLLGSFRQEKKINIPTSHKEHGEIFRLFGWRAIAAANQNWEILTALHAAVETTPFSCFTQIENLFRHFTGQSSASKYGSNIERNKKIIFQTLLGVFHTICFGSGFGGLWSVGCCTICQGLKFTNLFQTLRKNYRLRGECVINAK
jgi:hypothetical protein